MWYKIIIQNSARSFLKCLKKEEQAKFFDALEQLAKKRWFVGKLIDRAKGLKTICLYKYRIIYKVEYKNLIIFSIKNIKNISFA